MASALAAHKGHDARSQFVPFQMHPARPSAGADLGRRHSCRSGDGRATRAVAAAYPIMCVAACWPSPASPTTPPVCCLALLRRRRVATCRWLAGRRGRRALGRRWASVSNVVVSARFIALPLLTGRRSLRTPRFRRDQPDRSRPDRVADVRAPSRRCLHQRCRPSDRDVAVVICGQLRRRPVRSRCTAAADGLPAQIYSGQNSSVLPRRGRLVRQPSRSSSASTTTSSSTSQFASCVERGHLDEQCRHRQRGAGPGDQSVPRAAMLPWPQLWPAFPPPRLTARNPGLRSSPLDHRIAAKV